MKYDLRQYASREEMAQELADLIAMRLTSRIHATGVARLAVPGGSTPGPMLSALGAKDLDWDNVVVTLTDERWVPVSSDRSNQRLLSESLFQGMAASATFVPLYSGAPEPRLGLDAVCLGLEQAALPLDIAVLGMGADMHTASLFPGALGLEQALSTNAPAAIAITAPGADEQRISLSAAALNPAERHIQIQGSDKRDALARAVGIGTPLEAPICAVLDGATVHYAD